MKPKLLLCLALVLSGGLFGCATKYRLHSSNWHPPPYDWPVFYDCAKINSAKTNELGKVDGLLVIEAQLVLTDMYYSDVVMILQEVESGRFLPVYVQDYNRDIQWPTANVITNEEDKIIVNAGMDYAGTGHFHNHYKIIISTNQYPVVIGP